MSTLQSKMGDGLNIIQDTLQQGKQKVATVQEVAQIKQQLELLRQKRMEQLLSLGNIIHKEIRQGRLADPAYAEISRAITQIDMQVYELAKSLELLKQQEESKNQCPACKKPVGEKDKFCGVCGETLPVFESVVVNEISCTHCEMLIPEESTFCPCCGFTLNG